MKTRKEPKAKHRILEGLEQAVRHAKATAKPLRPMLSAKVESIEDLPYPLLASPKLDGVRALVVNGVLVSRNLKPIPNAWCRALFGGAHMEGLDGELIVGDAFVPGVFDRTQSGVMSRDGKPDVRFHVFDHWKEHGGYGARMAQVRRQMSDGRFGDEVVKVPQHKVFKPSELQAYEQECVDKGFEGVMLRKLAADTPYKFGRSTLKEALLMKLIRRNTMEGVVVDAVEQLHNANEKTVDARGYAKRSKVKANLVPTGKLGALVLTADRDTKAPVITTFEVGTGMTDAQRVEFWHTRKSLIGKIVTVEYRELTKDNVPRFPTFKGFRHKDDI